MAYAYSINSQFKPFSYAELLAPVQASTEAHQKVEDEYTVLSAQAETLREKAMQESVLNPDSKWAKKYMAYADKLEQSAADLAKYGLRPSTRQQIFQAKKDYYNSVDPAIKAIEQQKKLSDAQYAQSPALRMVYGDMPTVDELIADPTKKPVAYSGSDVYTQAMTSTKMASARNIIKDAIEKSSTHTGYYDQIKEVGYNNIKKPNDILDNKDLKAIYGIIEKQFGNFEGVSEANKEKLKQEALKGAFDGVMYDKKTSMQFDAYGQEQRGYAHQEKMAREQREWQQEQAENQFEHEKELAMIKAGLLDSDGTTIGGGTTKTKGHTKDESTQTRMVTSEDYKDFKDDIYSKLTVGNNGALSVAYFGGKRNGRIIGRFVNPMKVYEDIIQGAKEARRQFKNSDNYSDADIEKLRYKEDGLTELLTQKQYKALKDLGLSSTSTQQEFRNKLTEAMNSKVINYNHHSVNLANIERPSEIIVNNIVEANNREVYKGKVFKQNKNGTKGDKVAFDDLPLYKNSTSEKEVSAKNTITDIRYSQQEPGYVSVVIDGKDYYIDPSLIDNQAATIVKNSNYLISLNDTRLRKEMQDRNINVNGLSGDEIREAIAQNTIYLLRTRFNSYNQLRSNTNSAI